MGEDAYGILLSTAILDNLVVCAPHIAQSAGWASRSSADDMILIVCVPSVRRCSHWEESDHKILSLS